MEIKNIRLVIIQPTTRKTPSEWDCTPEVLAKDTERTKERAYHAIQVWKCESPGAYHHHQRPGEKQCTFCRAKADCQKYAETVRETVFNNKDALTGMESVETELKPYMPIEPNLLAAYYLRLPLIEAWVESIRKKVFEKMKAGEIGEAQGLKFVAGRKGNRQWDNPAEVEEMLKSMKLRQDEMYNFTLISPAQAEKVLKENPRKWTKAQKHIEQKDGAPSIAHVSDTRPAISIAPNASGMEVVEESPPLVTEAPPPVTEAPPPAVVKDDGNDLC